MRLVHFTWSDVDESGCDILFVPPEMSLEHESQSWRQWYRAEYCPRGHRCRCGRDHEFKGFIEWVQLHGAKIAVEAIEEFDWSHVFG